MTRLFRTFAAVAITLFVFLVFSPPAPAQTVTGTLEGHVADSAGGAMPGARILVKSLETSAERATETNRDGFYQVPYLPLGAYRVVAERQGFRTVEKTSVVIELNKTTVSDFTLEVSRVREVVTVTGEAPQIETTAGEIKQSISSEIIEDRPMAGRNFLSLMELVPGFQHNPFSGANNPTLSTGSYANFNGTGTRSATFQIDGVNNDDSSENQNRQGVNLSAIKEFQVITNAYSAEFGRGAGAVVLVQTKSGANRFHGDLFEYLQNSRLVANGFFGNASGRRADGSLISPVSPLKRNQFGYTVGGPLRKERLFFFHTFEQTRYRQSTVFTRDIFLPTEKLQVGDCEFCLKPAEHANVQADLAFLQSILDRFPKAAPNNPSSSPRAYTAQSASDFPDQDYSLRLDGRPNDRNNVTARYQYSRNRRRPGEIIKGEAAQQNHKQQSVGLTATHVFSNTMVGEFRFGLGLRTTLVDISGGNQTPVVRFSGTPGNPSSIGNAGAFPINRYQTDYQFVYNHTKILGKQGIKLGIDHRIQRLADLSDNNSRGVWTFGATPRPAEFGGGQYSAYDNFRRGWIGSFSRGFGNFRLHNRMGEQNYYILDDIKLRPNFTLNLGFRYELVFAPEERDRLINYGYRADTNNFEPRFGFAWSPAFRNGLLGRLTAGPGKTSVRGGYGLFHSRLFQSIFSQGGANLRAQPPNAIFRSFDPTFNVGDPTQGFVFQPGFPTGRISLLQVDPNLGMPYTQQWNFTIERQLGWKTALSLNYTGTRGIGLLFYQWTNRARFPIVSPVDGVLYDKVDPNLANTSPAPGFISISQPRTNERRPDTRYSNLLIASNGVWSYYHALNVRLTKRLSRGLHFLSTYTWSKAIDTGSEATSSGSDANATMSEIDAARSLRGLSIYHAAHRFVFNWSYKLPSPAGVFGDDASSARGKVSEGLVGGWTFSGTYTTSTGQPYTAFAGYDYNADGLGFDRPVLLDTKLLGRSVDNPRINPATGLQFAQEELPGSAFSPRFGFSVAERPWAPGTSGEGSVGRNTFFLQGMNNWDVGIYKAFRVREGHSLTFRAELYNAFNRAQFGFPTQSVLTSFTTPAGLASAFSRLLSQRSPTNYVGAGRAGSGSRFLQFALRYVF